MSFPLPAAQGVSVCWVDVSPVTARDASAWVTQLPQDEQDRFNRYRHPTSSYQFLIGRLLIRKWLASVSGTPFGEWQLAEGQRGRPHIAHPSSPWAFNLAHSGSLVACGLSLIPEVGVDLEDLERRSPHGSETRDLARRFCAPKELADIERQPEPAQARRFLMYWTLKEAYLKARGLGIAVHLADVEFALDRPHPTIDFRASLEGTSRDWTFELLHPTPRYLLSVAVPHVPGTTRPAIELRELALDAVTA